MEGEVAAAKLFSRTANRVGALLSADHAGAGGGCSPPLTCLWECFFNNRRVTRGRKKHARTSEDFAFFSLLRVDAFLLLTPSVPLSPPMHWRPSCIAKPAGGGGGERRPWSCCYYCSLRLGLLALACGRRSCARRSQCSSVQAAAARERV